MNLSWGEARKLVTRMRGEGAPDEEILQALREHGCEVPEDELPSRSQAGLVISRVLLNLYRRNRRSGDLVIAVFFGGPLLILLLVLVSIAFVVFVFRPWYWGSALDAAFLAILALAVILLSVGIVTLLRARGRESKGRAWIWAAVGLLVLLSPVVASGPNFRGHDWYYSTQPTSGGGGWYITTGDLLLTFALAAVYLLAGVMILVRRPGRGWRVLTWLGMGAAVLILCAPPSARWLHVPEHEAARDRRYCLSNLKQMALAQLMYASDFDDRLPPPENWPESTAPYGWAYNVRARKTLLCLADRNRERQTSGDIETSYTMNELLGGQQYTWDTSNNSNKDVTPLLFDGTELYGTHEAADFRHAEMGLRWTKPKSTGLNVVYADGHGEHLTSEQFRHVRMGP